MSDPVSQLTLEMHPGEQVMLDGGRISVELIAKSGKVARLRVTAPREMSIEREGSGQPRTMRDSMAAS